MPAQSNQADQKKENQPAGQVSEDQGSSPTGQGSSSASGDLNIPPVVTVSKEGGKSKSGNKMVIIAAIIGTLILVGGVVVGVVLIRRQQDIRREAEGSFNQCEGPWGPIPCGSCSINEVNADGTMAFECQLNCGGSASDCPGGSAGNYFIRHRWEKCNNAGSEACTSDSFDYLESGDLGGAGPWWIAGQSTVNGSGTYPIIDCGRVQVDVQMEDTGTSVAGGVYDTGVDCGVATPTPTATPVSTPTSTPAATPTPTPPPIPECREIKAYDVNWNLLDSEQLSNVNAGDKVRFAVLGAASSGFFDKAKFSVNGVISPEVDDVKPGSDEFYYEYIIKETDIERTMTVSAWVHHSALNKWY
jgi:hypothetical protein